MENTECVLNKEEWLKMRKMLNVFSIRGMVKDEENTEQAQDEKNTECIQYKEEEWLKIRK